jgi:hypothetical protein
MCPVYATYSLPFLPIRLLLPERRKNYGREFAARAKLSTAPQNSRNSHRDGCQRPLKQMDGFSESEKNPLTSSYRRLPDESVPYSGELSIIRNNPSLSKRRNEDLKGWRSVGFFDHFFILMQNRSLRRVSTSNFHDSRGLKHSKG